MDKDQQPETQAHVVYPHPALLWDDLARTPAMPPLLLGVAVVGATLLWLHREAVPLWVLKYHPFAICWGALTLLLVALGVVIGLKVFAFHRIRYVFSPLGIRVEGGIHFHSDLIAWVQINDVNVSASITEQLFGCGTIIVGTYKFGPQFLRFISNFKELRSYMEAHLKHNLTQARTINAI